MEYRAPFTNHGAPLYGAVEKPKSFMINYIHCLISLLLQILLLLVKTFGVFVLNSMQFLYKSR